MADDTTTPETTDTTEQAETKTYTEDEVKQLLEQETSGLKSKVSELLGETKAEREKRQALEQAQQQAEEERQKEKGEFKSLYEKTQSELEAERENARKFRQTIQQKELESAASSLAGQLSRDSKRAELLKKEALQFAVYTDEGVKFEVGGVEMPAEKLMEKMREDYDFLVDGSQATGGGAPGSRTGSGAAPVGKLDGTKAERAAYFANRFKIN
ncbi:MAG: hypothetical protein R3215_02135 [Halomonas sp.]|nr:hypothetical protein [Halomonas sp.]